MKSLSDWPLPGLATRNLTVVVLNHSKDELILGPGSGHLAKGSLGGPADSDPVPILAPAGIQPGESVIWRCGTPGIGRGIQGSVVYMVTGSEPPHPRVRFTWKTRCFGPNKYSAETSDKEHHIEIKGGEGEPAVVVFVFSRTGYN